MSTSPATIPLEYQLPPRRDSQARIIAICWIVILAALAAIALANWRGTSGTAQQQMVRSLQVQMSAKMGVGEVHQMQRWGIKPAQVADVLVAKMKEVAVTPKQKLQVAIAIGELRNGKDAIAELTRIHDLMSDAANQSDWRKLEKVYADGPPALLPGQREELIARHGWFGRLALSYGLQDSDPFRAEVLREATRAFVAVASVELGAGLAALIGFVLLILGIILLATGWLRPAFRPTTPPASAFLESFALYLAGYVLISLAMRWAGVHSMLLGATVATAWIVLAMLWPIRRGVSLPELRNALGWHKGRGVIREMGLGIVGYIAGLPIVLLAILLSAVLAQRSRTIPIHPIEFADLRTIGQIIGLYLLASVWAPLVEESLFRGALFNHLRQRHGWWISALLSAFIFAALHPQGWVGLPTIGAIGFVLAGIREWRGTFVASATAHSLNNAVVATLLVLVMR